MMCDKKGVKSLSLQIQLRHVMHTPSPKLLTAPASLLLTATCNLLSQDHEHLLSASRYHARPDRLHQSSSSWV
jgi:hypothetical protein